jgi:hypothetical protein
MFLHGRARRKLLVVGILITSVFAGAMAPTANAAPITICHSTGSPSAPWVFVTIDDSDWPDYQARGDFRATSLADCRTSAATLVPQQALLGAPLQQQPPVTPTAQPATAQPAATPATTATPAATRAATPAPTLAGTAVAPSGTQTVEVAGATVLPPSGEPVASTDPLFVAFVALGGLGLVLRMLSYRQR